jgi:hypothetical protein
MVSRLVLSHEAFIALDDRVYWLFDGPFSDVAEGFTADRSLLRRL